MATIDVKSAAGKFEVEIEKVTAVGDQILLVGTMDGLDCTTVVPAREAFRLLRLGLRREVLSCLFRSLRRARLASSQ
jgi:hypothetical protein